MNRHQGNLIITFGFVLVHIRKQTHFLEIMRERSSLALLSPLFHKRTHAIHQFLKILLLGNIIRILAMIYLTLDSTLAHDTYSQLISIRIVGRFMERLNERDEVLQFGNSPFVYRK